ncbi:MAG: CPBP family intramembrane glutamic endopeptidase [Planctomycetota bacterium]
MQPHGYSLSDYTRESARPLVSLVFVAPLLIIYELGILLLGPHALRNGADTWLRNLLESLGFGQYFLLPLLTCAILLGWHHTRHESWSLDRGVLPTMLLESLLFAMVLFGVAHVQRALCAPALTPIVSTSGEGVTAGIIGRLIGYCGAGIYEEVLFRLMLLPATAGVLKWTGFSWRSSWIWGIVVTSLIFSAAHYEVFTAGGYAFDLRSFIFRFLAGSFFATLFVLRSFGIAVGSHALYDILVELI